MHIVNHMLTIPPNPVLLLTESKLTLGVALLNKAGLLSTTNRDLVSTIFGVPDITIFMPNSQKAIDSFTAMASTHSSQTDLASIFNYHVIPNFIGIAHHFTDGQQLKTSQGQSLMVTKQVSYFQSWGEGLLCENCRLMREQGNDTFVDGAKLISSDFLIGNGVLHVLDDTVNPFNRTIPPTPTSLPTTTKKTYSTALGIGISIAFLVPVSFGIFLFWFFLRKRKNAGLKDGGGEKREGLRARQIEIRYAKRGDIPVGKKMGRDGEYEIDFSEMPDREPRKAPKRPDNAYRPPSSWVRGNLKVF